MKAAVLLTVYNRIEKTIVCLNSLFESIKGKKNLSVTVYLTDDGSTDGTAERLQSQFASEPLVILKGNGNLFWNGGMIHSWKAALTDGGYDGYLWLNNDTEIFPNLWDELADADHYSKSTFGQGGIYIGSSCDGEKTRLTYGGFNFTNLWTLKDRFVIPDGTFQSCRCAHGNVTYISQNVVDRQGMLCDRYLHGGGDHDYTYLAYKKGFPVFVLRDFVAVCENDHPQDGWGEFLEMGFRDRIRFLNSPLGFNLKNTLLFQKRCFPYRYPFVWLVGCAKALFPKTYFNSYRYLRK